MLLTIFSIKYGSWILAYKNDIGFHIKPNGNSVQHNSKMDQCTPRCYDHIYKPLKNKTTFKLGCQSCWVRVERSECINSYTTHIIIRITGWLETSLDTTCLTHLIIWVHGFADQNLGSRVGGLTYESKYYLHYSED